MKRIIVSLLGLFLWVTSAYAVNSIALKPTIMLNSITTVKAGERTGDELYFDINVIRENQQRTVYRVPKKPIHWHTTHLDNIKNFSLWSEEIKPNHSVILLIALMDQDLVTMNPDDLIGLIRVELRNNNGLLNVDWSIPNRSGGPGAVKGKKGGVQQFELYSKHGQYDVFLSVQK